jgi:hypothetical protein
MQADLFEFLSRIAGAVALSLLPVVLTAFLTMPSSLHRHAADQAIDPNAPVAHMT